jgi:hypothetical protein
MTGGDWHQPNRTALGVLLDRTGVEMVQRDNPEGGAGDSFLMLFNAGPVAVDFVIPAPVTADIWEVVFDTREGLAAVPAHSFREGTVYSLQRRSLALLADRG